MKEILPLISIVVPVYKSEKYIKNVIRSLEYQTFKNFEIIFVDDGSPDNSVKIIEEQLLGKDIKFSIIHQGNSGQGIARNTGVKNANGQWVFFIDSDDVIQSWTLELYVKAIDQHPNADLFFSKFQYVSESNAFLQTDKIDSIKLIEKKELLHNFLTRKVTVLVPGTLYKVSMLKEKNIWQTSIRWSEDQHFMWRVLDNIDCGVFIDSCSYNYLQRSTNSSIMTSTPIDLMLKAYEEFVELQKSIANEEVKQFLLARWVLGCLHVLAHRKEKNNWLSFYEAVDGKEHLKKLKKFPQWKQRLLARIGLINKKLLYTLLKI